MSWRKRLRRTVLPIGMIFFFATLVPTVSQPVPPEMRHVAGAKLAAGSRPAVSADCRQHRPDTSQAQPDCSQARPVVATY